MTTLRARTIAAIDRPVSLGGAKFRLSAVLTLLLLFASVAVPAETSSVAGSWRGGGWVSFASGNKDKARCRAQYTRARSGSYELHATCATASGSASQTATVYEVSPNSLSGPFHNLEYNVFGTIRIEVHGDSQSVTFYGDSGSASLTLRRR
jgi:hypothetical protein